MIEITFAQLFAKTSTAKAIQALTFARTQFLVVKTLQRTARNGAATRRIASTTSKSAYPLVQPTELLVRTSGFPKRTSRAVGEATVQALKLNPGGHQFGMASRQLEMRLQVKPKQKIELTGLVGERIIPSSWGTW